MYGHSNVTLIETWEEDIRPKDSNRKSRQSSYQSCKCIDRGHGSNKGKNFKRILKMETRHSELGRGDFRTRPCWMGGNLDGMSFRGASAQGTGGPLSQVIRTNG